MTTRDNHLIVIVPSQPLFPPPFTIDELKITYETYVDGRPPRSPTAFIIYRTAYQQQLIADNNLPPWCIFSHMASISYSREPRHVKNAYAHLSSSLRSMQ
ncbi:13178_t:CDS:1 [Dentiscutata erythropus]|uniref:13178_t:CDS:1 n=1 Tax=Dentiscutata erythropus TaxID=1348616 RepID=A0A9N9FLC7_9GLOM|nr:13178_t:CDS:1 [Dentiscutata erythropus]